MLAAISVGVALIGFYFAWLLYYKRPELPDKITAKDPRYLPACPPQILRG